MIAMVKNLLYQSWLNSVCADPSKIIDPVKASAKIAEILNLDKSNSFQKNILTEKFLLAGQKNFS